MNSEMRTSALRFACVVGLVAMASGVMANDDANNNVATSVCNAPPLRR